MDNEADDLELRRILKSLSKTNPEEGTHTAEESSELMGSWDRYHQIRASLQSESSAPVPDGFLSRIQTALAEEPVPSRETADSGQLSAVAGTSRHTWLTAFGQGAIAASVAALVLVFSYQAMNPSDEAGQAVPVTAQAEAAANGFSQVANISGKLDEDSLARLRQAVYREFEEDTQSLEIPVSYNFENQ